MIDVFLGGSPLTDCDDIMLLCASERKYFKRDHLGSLDVGRHGGLSTFRETVLCVI